MLSAQQFQQFQRFAYPIHLTIVMSLLMGILTGHLHFPDYFRDLLVYIPASISIGVFLLDIPKLSDAFLAWLDLNPGTLRAFIIKQVPPAVIFSLVMSSLARLIHGVDDLSGWMSLFTEQLFSVPLSVLIQMAVTLLINQLYRPILTNNGL